MNYDYAAQIARRWNTEDEFSGNVGFVTEFELADEFISKYEVRNVGGKEHNEYWIPSEELMEMNKSIIGSIQITGSYYGSGYKGILAETVLFKNMTVEEQALEVVKNSGEIIDSIATEKAVILANISYWELNALIPKEIIFKVKESWVRNVPEVSLDKTEMLKDL